MRTLGIDYGDSRVGIAITDPLGFTAQGLETISHGGSDKVLLRRLDEIFAQYEIDTIVVGMPLNMDGTKTDRAEITEKFIDSHIGEMVERMEECAKQGKFEYSFEGSLTALQIKKLKELGYDVQTGNQYNQPWVIIRW